MPAHNLQIVPHDIFSDSFESTVAVFADEPSITNIFDKLGILTSSTYLKPALIELITKAFRSNLELTHQFLDGKVSLTEVCRSLASAMNSSELKYQKPGALEDLSPGDQVVHCLVRARVTEKG